MLKSSAKFSPAKDYRWGLTRYINDSKKELIFMGLNPSIADEKQNDQTLRRLIGFAELWGYGSLVVINLFAKISKSPHLLFRCDDPVGWHNNFELNKQINYWSINDLCELWIGWGVKGKFMNRNEEVMIRIKKTSKRQIYLWLH